MSIRQVYVCRQCQKMYFKAFVRQVVTEEVEMELDDEGLEHTTISNVTNRVQSHYDCPEHLLHDTWKIYIPIPLYDRLYLAYKDKGVPIRIDIQDTPITFYNNPDEIEGRMFDATI